MLQPAREEKNLKKNTCSSCTEDEGTKYTLDDDDDDNCSVPDLQN